jgi:hypothetical protein
MLREPRGDLMAHIESRDDQGLAAARQQARQAGYIHNAQMMLVAAGITAFGIVAVAATMMTSLL